MSHCGGEKFEGFFSDLYLARTLPISETTIEYKKMEDGSWLVTNTVVTRSFSKEPPQFVIEDKATP